VERVVVLVQGILFRGCLKELVYGRRLLWWWKTIYWMQVGEEEWCNQELIQAPKRRRVRMQRKLLVELGQSFSILWEYLGDRLIIHILSARSKRHRSGQSFFREKVKD
jgi:hypothetical protein